MKDPKNQQKEVQKEKEWKYLELTVADVEFMN
jgi:hypothetical protein